MSTQSKLAKIEYQTMETPEEKSMWVISVNCFKCGFNMTQSDKSSLYEQLQRMIGCPKCLDKTSLQTLYKHI